eukprot:530428-Karenia_brevis.AAC.1
MIIIIIIIIIIVVIVIALIIIIIKIEMHAISRMKTSTAKSRKFRESQDFHRRKFQIPEGSRKVAGGFAKLMT